MLTRSELRKIAKSRLRDARPLLVAGRYDGALYLCGYVLACQLKARIVAAYGWDGCPETRAEFDNLQRFKTDDLEVLLHLCGRERQVSAAHMADWSEVIERDPELRYQRVGTVTRPMATRMLDAVAALLRHV